MSRGRVISVRLSDEERAALSRMAERRRMPLSVFVREAALSLSRPYRGWSSTPPTTNGHGTIIPTLIRS